MAKAKAINGSKLIIRIDDGSGSNFVARCSINADREFGFSSSPSEAMIPDCDNPDDPSWIEREIDGLSVQITGSGMLHTLDIDFFWTWFKSGDSRAVQCAVDVPAAEGGGWWYGDAVLSAFTPARSAGKRDKATFECTILSDGPWDWQDAA